MTSDLTLLCPEGIVVAADMRETTIFPGWTKIEPEIKDGVLKIYPLKNIPAWRFHVGAWLNCLLTLKGRVSLNTFQILKIPDSK